MRYIFGDEIHSDPFHIAVIRDKLNRSLVPRFADVYDELDAAFKDMIQANKDSAFNILGRINLVSEVLPVAGWTTVPVTSVMRVIVARISGRVFVGLPLCK